jgi:quinol monooxygenase YgiN
MLIRIVRMTFQSEFIPNFLAVFHASKDKIRAFEGCHHLELLQDADKPNVLMTYSYWESAEALENYRLSELFQVTWAKTKPLFADKPVAFSVNRLEIVR